MVLHPRRQTVVTIATTRTPRNSLQRVWDLQCRDLCRLIMQEVSHNTEEILKAKLIKILYSNSHTYTFVHIRMLMLMKEKMRRMETEMHLPCQFAFLIEIKRQAEETRSVRQRLDTFNPCNQKGPRA
jgi:hypothetical protein